MPKINSGGFDVEILSGLDVGPFYYKIRRENNVVDLGDNMIRTDDAPSNEKRGETRLYGFCQHNPPEIVLNMGLVSTPQRLSAVLMHEALHAIEDAYSLSLEEDVVERLAIALVALFYDNEHTLPFVACEGD